MRIVPRDEVSTKYRLAAAALMGLLALSLTASAQNQTGATAPPAPYQPKVVRVDGPQDIPASIRRRQKRELRKDRFEKLQKDADDLATLANSLNSELGKSNENILSLDVIEKAEKIEKLAKKIQDEAKLGVD